MVSYHDVTNGALKVAHCTDSACTTATLAVDKVLEIDKPNKAAQAVLGDLPLFPV